MAIYYLSQNIRILTRIFLRIKTFSKSLLFHIYSGFPKSTQEEIEYRYSVCSSCDLFHREMQQCLSCGCNINKKKIFMNKLAWADQSCPIGRWAKIVRNNKNESH